MRWQLVQTAALRPGGTPSRLGNALILLSHERQRAVPCDFFDGLLRPVCHRRRESHIMQTLKTPLVSPPLADAEALAQETRGTMIGRRIDRSDAVAAGVDLPAIDGETGTAGVGNVIDVGL